MCNENKNWQEFLTNKRKEVGKKKKNSCKQATEVPPGEGEGRPFPLCRLINRVTYTVPELRQLYVGCQQTRS